MLIIFILIKCVKLVTVTLEKDKLIIKYPFLFFNKTLLLNEIKKVEIVGNYSLRYNNECKIFIIMKISKKKISCISWDSYKDIKEFIISLESLGLNVKTNII